MMAAKGGHVRGAAWTVISRIGIQLSHFALLLVAARFLGPADFGVFALVSAVVMGFACLAQAGWREFMIVADSRDDRARANTCALMAGVTGCGVGLLAGAGYWLVFDEQITASLIAALSIWLIPATLAEAQAGLLTYRGRLVILAQVQLAGELCGVAAGIAALAAGWGMFALVAARLTAQILAIGGLLIASRWFALTGPRTALNAGILVFSRQILVVRMLGFLNENFALFVVGALLGPAAAGLYRAGARFVGAISEVIGEAFRRTAWSVFRAARDEDRANGSDSRLVSARGAGLLSALLMVAGPLFVGLAITSDSVIETMLGEQWTDAASVLLFLAVARFLLAPGLVSEPMLASRGRVAWVQYLALFRFATSLIFLLLFAPFGLEWAAASQVIAALIVLPVFIWAQERLGGLRWKLVLAACWPSLLLAMPAMAGAVIATAQVTEAWGGVWSLLAQGSVGAGAYAGVLWLTGRGQLGDIRAMLGGGGTRVSEACSTR